MKINDESDKKTSTLTSSRVSKVQYNDSFGFQFNTNNGVRSAATKKKSKSNRDSLAFRESPGKPGTKRFNRYLNTQFLKTAGSLGDNINAEMDYSFTESKNTLFYQDSQNSTFYFDNMVNITCDQEEELIDSIQQQTKNAHNESTADGEQLFSKLRKSLRPFFKKSFLLDNLFIQETEQQILEFLENSSIKQMEYNQSNPSKRIIIHGLSSYYSLQSKSHSTKNGQRILVIRKPRNLPPLPEISITQYLAAESKKKPIQIHQVQKKKVIKKSQSIYIKKKPIKIENEIKV
ncbi:hypothetical protein DICPUDRAFT_98760 [Dictyostelium purpureum]|uniref:R3H domain-containing protein n=1 Tax=Dictyostelium purpureum TaxID=5786 RepID=F0ZTA8_DICPU|nr:uncharacterized protein DICPUDRAFT_98760 [Dictyostelium purpureum]EGC32832.1 hypothetical protein DICPUDRAFT_98760 [Dictyostelium purpureum]|eukprot:XP_003290655.1 hypothetical protein DICPUDRAFT_98760 [Dictyostelium purpureum]